MARTPFFFVRTYHGRLNTDVPRNQPVQFISPNAHIGDLFDTIFQKGEKFGIANDAVLNDFGHPGYQFTTRQRAKRIGIDKDEFGLVKGSNQVFPQRVIDPRLTADVESTWETIVVGTWTYGTPRK